MTPPPQIPVGILSAPREVATLAATIESLTAAGFASSMLFEDRESIGCYAAWRLMLARMLWMFPRASWLMLCEDDCQFSAGLADYLANLHLPFTSVLSPYCAAANYLDGVEGWHEVHPRRSYGALCYVLPRHVAIDFHQSPPHPEWLDGTDVAMGQFCQRNEIPYYVHNPSLVRHTGDTTTLSLHKATDPNDRFRQCEIFARRICPDQGPLDLWHRPRNNDPIPAGSDGVG